jgi:hypothetical protein
MRCPIRLATVAMLVFNKSALGIPNQSDYDGLSSCP